MLAGELGNFLRVLVHAGYFVPIEGADWPANGRQGGELTGDGHIGNRILAGTEGKDFVFHGRAEQADAVVEFPSFAGVVNGEIDPGIDHVGGVDVRVACRAHVVRNGYRDEDFFTFPVVVIRFQGQAVIEQPQFKSHVGTGRFLPLEQRVGQADNGGPERQLFIRTENGAEVVGDGGHSGVGGEFVVTQAAPAGADLEVVDESLGFHERLFRYPPG